MTLGLIITILALGITLFVVINQCKKAKGKLNADLRCYTSVSDRNEDL